MRKVCVITGTRAEYGLLYWLMKEIQAEPTLQLQVVVCAMHLSPEFGLTWRELEKDGFQIDERVEMLLSSDTPTGVAKSIGLGVIGFADVFARLKPDVAVILGDRFEMLAAAQAAMTARIPIAHIHGGEVTEGAMDESIRHAITKMSHLHFVTAEPYRRRVIQLGEQPEKVFTVGSPGVDNIKRLALPNREGLESSLGLRLNTPLFLVTYHPVTLGTASSGKVMGELLSALDQFPKATVLFTMPNSDMDGRIIMELINGYVAKNPGRTSAYASMGQVRYLGAMKLADVIVGNSSSGILEAPFLRKAVVNIGDRQKGRLKASSIIDCGEGKEEITAAIQRALSPEFQNTVQNAESLFGTGDAAVKMIKALKETDFSALRTKRFFDVTYTL
jgi:UDP-N-acetylglucosamine 2-epimerase (non-hydrolysing)/GDP/UDP-N,N'-diacetylbacillosamine 2-epimerase (hydrolysing)